MKKLIIVTLLTCLTSTAYAKEFCGKITMLKGLEYSLIALVKDSIDGTSNKGFSVNQPSQISLVQLAVSTNHEICYEHDGFSVTLRLKNL